MSIKINCPSCGDDQSIDTDGKWWGEEIVTCYDRKRCDTRYVVKWQYEEKVTYYRMNEVK